MQAPHKTSWVQLLLLALVTAPLSVFAQPNLGTECATDTGAWAPWGTVTVDLTNRPGFAHIVTAAEALGGIQLTNGAIVTNYPPPWHFEIALERPTDVNTAVGLLITSDGLQALFDSLIQPLPPSPSDPVVGFGSAAGFGNSGKNFTAAPDFSSVPRAKMSGKRMIIYCGLVDDRTMRFGVRPDEGAAWAFAPDFDIGFSASNSPPSFSNFRLMVENRSPWYNYVGPLQGESGALGPPGPTDIYVDYIHFTSDLTPGSVSSPPQGSPLMVAHYNFEADLTDASGHDLNGTATGTVPFESGEFGQMATFNNDNGMSTANNALLNFGTNAFSAAAWVRVDSTGAAQNLLAKTDGGANGIIIQTVPGASASLVIKNGAGTTVAGPFNNLFPVAELHNVAVVYDPLSSPAGKLYVDGVLKTTFAASFNINNTGDLQIGFAASRPGSGARLAMDDFRLYNYAISASDVTRFIPPPPVLSTEFATDTGSWVTYNGASSSLNTVPGFDSVTVGMQNFGGLDLPIGVLVNKYPPPWHFEVAFNRPTNINTAVGVLFSQGIQCLFHSVISGGNIVSGFGSAGFDGGKGTANTPDFSGIDGTNMAGTRLVMFIGQVDDRHMRWGIRPGETAAWSFAPDFDIGFNASNAPVSWPDMKLMIETRDEWFNFVAPGSSGPTTNTTIAFDYIRFSTNLTPGPIVAADRGSEFTTTLSPWSAWRSATANINDRAGYARVVAPAGDFSGLTLNGGIPVTSYAPPWHFEIAFERPTNVNSAIGVLFGQGIQALFHSLSNGTVNGFAAATFNGGKGAPPAPDFSAVPASQLSGSRLIIYVGQLDDTHMRWGVRSGENQPWSYAPDINLGFSASAVPVSWPDMQLMIENRAAWFAQFGASPPPGAVTVDVDYIRFSNSTNPSPVIPATDFSGNSSLWTTYNGAVLDLSFCPGQGRLITPAAQFSGVQVAGGIPVDKYPPPWHLEIALERPTNVNTAIGMLLTDGIQGLFHSLSNGTVVGFQAATFNGSGKGVPQAPDFSSVSGASNRMTGPRLIMYIGQVDDRHMRWGVRAREDQSWRFAPDIDLGFNASASPVSFQNVRLMVENRDAWFNQFGATGPSGPVTVYIDYINFITTTNPGPIVVGSRSSEFTSSLGAWGPYNGSTVSLTNRPGYARVTVTTNNFDGLIVSGGVLVNEFPPPWHFEIALERPTNVNTAIGFLLPADAGLQCLFHSLTNGTVGFGAAVFGQAKAAPDFSGVPASQITGPRMNLYVGMLDDRTMRWGVRPDEGAAWYFAPDLDLGYSTSASSPITFSDFRLMVENRNGWFAQFPGSGGAAPVPVDVDVDYIRFFPYDVLPSNLGSLTIKQDGSYLLLCRTSSVRAGIGRIQTASSVNGPWTDAPDQTAPQIIVPGANSTFYRLVQ